MVFVLLAMLSAASWWFPLRGTLSLALLCLTSLLALPWSLLLLKRDRAEPSPGAQPGATDGSSSRVLLLRLLLVALLGGFLIAQWFVLLRAEGRPEFVGTSRSYSLAVLLVTALGLFARSMPATRLMALVSDHPARLMALSFGGAGVLGAAVLSLPLSVHRVSAVSLVDNLFMAFSAVCVTGLAVNNVATTYTLFGQAVLCVLMQIGGLGIMVLSAAFAIIAGQKLRVKSSAVIAQMVDASSLASMRRTVLMILVYTLLVEGAGALLLHAQFRDYPNLAARAGADLSGPGSLWWAAVFHAVSAFCNAGFSNTSAGLLPFVGDAGVVLVVSTLVVLGGLGFPVLDELFRAAFTRLRRRRLTAFSLHTRVSVRMTLLLLAAMTVVYLVFEWDASLGQLGPLERLTASLFQSASARTAGFNVVDVGAMRPAVLVLTCAAMFVGACPGSTGGGIKTTTVAVLFASMRAELRGHTPELLDRAVPEAVIRKAIGVAVLSLVIVVVASTLLLLIEPHEPLDLGFEVMSAFTTTGLSTGVTPNLSTFGKAVVIATMFIGRIGPLTLALALSLAVKDRSVGLPPERVLIG